MKLQNIIQSASEVLNVQDGAVLKRCANLVLGNIAANYRDCVTEQTFTVTNGKILYSQFDKNFLRIKSVSIGGAEVDYSLFTDFIKVPNGRVTVKYCYMPVFENDTDEIELPGVSEQCFVYGVLTEYAIISGMFNEANIWGEKFESGLFRGCPKYKQIVLPRA